MGRALQTCIATVLGLGCLAVFAQDVSPGDAPTATAVSQDEPLYAARTTVDRIGRVVAPVMINGQGPFRMILDTGANQSVITKSLADTLGLVASEKPVLLNGVTGAFEVVTTLIDRLETGDLVQQSLYVPVVNSVMGGAEGILGTQGFEDKKVVIDFKRDRLSIENSRGVRASPLFVTVPAKLRFGRLLIVDGRVGRVKVKAVIDTGAQRTLGNLALRDALMKRRRADQMAIATSVIGMNEKEQEGDIIATPKIAIGELMINNLPVIYGDIYVFELWQLEEEPAILIGMDLLGMLDMLVIDYRREELHIRL